MSININKKIIKLISLIFMLVLAVGCTKSTNVEGNLTDIMPKLYEGIDELPNLETIEVNKDNIKNFLGTDELEYDSILASEPLISSIAHSVILIRAKDNADIESIKTKIKENINPRKWICVWVEDEDVIIKNKGNLIAVIVVEDENIRNKISLNFDSL